MRQNAGFKYIAMGFGGRKCFHNTEKNGLCMVIVENVKSNNNEFRLLPGRKTFQNGTFVDCDITNCIFKDITGVYTFKLYCQKNWKEAFDFSYSDHSETVGKLENIYFENIIFDKVRSDGFSEITVNGLFDCCADMKDIHFKNIFVDMDKAEYEKALAWIKANCKEGFDKNKGKNFPEIITKSKFIPADKDWEFIAKFTIIVYDILYGNPKLDELGWHEEALGKNAIVGGFQGQRNWTDWLPNADFTEAIMATSFNWNGKKMPTPFATKMIL